MRARWKMNLRLVKHSWMRQFYGRAMLRFHFTRFLLPVTALALATGAGVAGEPLAKDSPFLPRSTATAAAAGAANEGYQLAGYVAQDKGGMLSVTRVSDKRSFWTPLGGTANDITAVSYDSVLDQAVIRVGGRTLSISLRRSSVLPGNNIAPTVASSSPVAAPASPSTNPSLPPQPPLPAPGTQAFQEREARMLVTDLLEIGLEQRKAYEEAQRQAAAQGPRAPRAEAVTPPH